LSRVLQNFARAHVKEILERFLEEDEENQPEDVPMVTILEDKTTTQAEPITNVEPIVTSPKLDDIIIKIKHEVCSIVDRN